MHRTAVKKVVQENVLDANDTLARANRDLFDRAGTYTINMMSSPGAGKTAHEVVVPMRTVRGGDEDPVTGPSELDLVLRPHAVEHLKLKAIVPNAVALGERDDVIDDPFVMSRDRGERAVEQHAFSQFDVGAVDFRLARVGDARRLQIGALHQP